MRRARALALTAAACLALGAVSAPAQGTGGIEVTTFARAMQPGEVVRIDVACACGSTPPRATVFERDVALAPLPDGTRWQGFVGIDLDVAPGTYPLAASAGDDVRITELRVEEKQFRTRQLRVAPAYVDPPPAIVERILREADMLDALFQTVSSRGWQGAFEPPLPSRPSDSFGARSIFNGEVRNPHGGLDYASPAGTPIAAPAAGRVAVAEDLYFTGNTVILDHGLGLFSVMAHLSSIAVTQDAIVERGTIVGRVGATGRATGPHLHWGVRLRGARVDPLSLLAATK